MTLVSRDKRQIVGYDIAFDKSRERIQRLVDNAPKAIQYYSDAYHAYSEICYECYHLSLKNKSQTYTLLKALILILDIISLLYTVVPSAFSGLWRPCYLSLKFLFLPLAVLFLLNLIFLNSNLLFLFLLLFRSSFWALPRF